MQSQVQQLNDRLSVVVNTVSLFTEPRDV